MWLCFSQWDVSRFGKNRLLGSVLEGGGPGPSSPLPPHCWLECRLDGWTWAAILSHVNERSTQQNNSLYLNATYQPRTTYSNFSDEKYIPSYLHGCCSAYCHISLESLWDNLGWAPLGVLVHRVPTRRPTDRQRWILSTGGTRTGGKPGLQAPSLSQARVQTEREFFSLLMPNTDTCCGMGDGVGRRLADSAIPMPASPDHQSLACHPLLRLQALWGDLEAPHCWS